MQTKWEYKLVKRSRGWDHDKNVKNAPWKMSTEWGWDMEEVLITLGDEGWELVAVSSRSDYLGGKDYNSVGTISLDYAGFTSSELWVFKRPKN